eukprot:gene3245-5688_t
MNNSQLEQEADGQIMNLMNQLNSFRDQVSRLRQTSTDSEHSHNNTTEGSSPTTGENPQQTIRINIQDILPLLCKVIPFVIIPSTIFLYYHYVGFFIFLMCLGSTLQTDVKLREQVSLRENRNEQKLLMIIFLSLIHLAVVFYFQPFYTLSQFFIYQNDQNYDFFMSIYFCLIVDFIVKISSMAFKGLLILIFGKFHEYHQGRIYHFVELISIIYRSTLAIGIWIPYFSKSFGKQFIISYSLIILYLSFKIFNIGNRIKNLFQFLTTIISGKPKYGRIASESEVLENGNCCSICQDEFVNPIVLDCEHIFCNSCITEWFQQEKTCPICRKTAEGRGEEKYVDGSSEISLMIF